MEDYILYGNDKLKTFYPNHNNAVLDSGASGNFLTEKAPQKMIQQHHIPVVIRQPDGNKMVSQHKSELRILKQLSTEAREAYTFKEITLPLISVAKFQKDKAKVLHQGKVIATAPRDNISKLWTMKLNNLNDCQPKHDKDLAMNVIVPEEAQNNIEKLILFLYEAIGFPTKTTLIKAVNKGHFATWPGLTVSRINKYIKQDIINDKGHMHMQRQKTKKITKKLDEKVDNSEEEALEPVQEPKNNKTNEYFAKIEETGLCGIDQTGKLPYTSKRGYKYIFVLYNYDPNAILVRPMKNRIDKEFLRVHDEVVEYL